METAASSPKPSWILLFASLATAVCLNFLFVITGALFHPSDAGLVVYGASIGFHFAEVVLVAVCIVLLPWNLGTRMVAGSCTIGLVAISVALSMRSARSPISFILGAVAICQCLIYQLPLWWLRASGWALGIPSVNSSASSAATDSRFGLRHIFVWTGIVSVFLAIARAVTQFALSDPQSPNSMDWSIFGILTLGNSILILPLIWGSFTEHRFLTWIGGSIVWAVILSPIEFYIISLLIPLIGNELWLFFTLNLTQVIATLLLLLALRSTGLRLRCNISIDT